MAEPDQSTDLEAAIPGIPTYGLDPNVLAMIQNGTLPAPAAAAPSAIAQPAVAPPDTSGLHPAIVDHILGRAPVPQPVAGPANVRLQQAAQNEHLGQAEEVAGVRQQQQAALGEGEVAAREADELAKSYQAQNKAVWGEDVAGPDGKVTHTPGIADQRQAQAQADAAALAQRQTAYETAVQREADYKIDDNRRWNNMGTGSKVLAGISLALSEIGGALQHRQGPSVAMQMIEGAIKDDVQAQMREREELTKRVGLAKDSIESYAGMSKSRLAVQDMKIAEEYKRAADKIQMQAAQYQSPLARIQAQKVAGDLQTKAGALISGAALVDHQQAQQDRAFTEQQLEHRQSIGVQYAQLAQQQKAHEDEINLRATGLIKEGKTDEAKALLAQDKELRETGIADLNTGGYLTRKDGGYVQVSEKEAPELHKLHAATIQAVDAIDRIRQLRAKFGTGDQLVNYLVSTEDGRQLAQESAQAILAIHKASGINRLSGEALSLSQDALTGSASIKGFKALAESLDRVRSDVVSNLDAEIKTRDPRANTFSLPDPLKQPKPEETDSQRALRGIENDSNFVGDKDYEANKAQILRWGKDVADPDPKVRAEALSNLARAADNSSEDNLKRWAVSAMGPAGIDYELAASPRSTQRFDPVAVARKIGSNDAVSPPSQSGLDPSVERFIQRVK